MAAFEANERVRAMEIQNTPTDYEERKKAFTELAVAREAAAYANQKLEERISSYSVASPSGPKPDEDYSVSLSFKGK